LRLRREKSAYDVRTVSDLSPAVAACAAAASAQPPGRDLRSIRQARLELFLRDNASGATIVV